jgi:hypothetical protein
MRTPVHMSAAWSAESEEITVALYSRWYRLRKRGLVPALLQEGSQVWTFSNPADPWGSRERVSVEQLASMCDQAEALDGLRRGPGTARAADGPSERLEEQAV